MRVKKLRQSDSVNPVVTGPKKPRGFDWFSYDNRICPHRFFSLVFTDHRQLLGKKAKGKNVFSSKKKFTKSY